MMRGIDPKPELSMSEDRQEKAENDLDAICARHGWSPRRFLSMPLSETARFVEAETGIRPPDNVLPAVLGNYLATKGIMVR